MEIKPYKQRGDTCVIACMIMFLEYYKIIPKATSHHEKRYYETYKSNVMKGVPLSACAFHLSKSGLDVEVIHEEKNYFKNEAHMTEDTYITALLEYKLFLEKAINFGASVKIGVKIDTELLKNKLKEGKNIILVGVVENTLHAILLIGFENEEFKIIDPLIKKIDFRKATEIEKYSQTKYGKWLLTIEDNRKE